MRRLALLLCTAVLLALLAAPAAAQLLDTKTISLDAAKKMAAAAEADALAR